MTNQQPIDPWTIDEPRFAVLMERIASHAEECVCVECTFVDLIPFILDADGDADQRDDCEACTLLAAWDVTLNQPAAPPERATTERECCGAGECDEHAARWTCPHCGGD